MFGKYLWFSSFLCAATVSASSVTLPNPGVYTDIEENTCTELQTIDYMKSKSPSLEPSSTPSETEYRSHLSKSPPSPGSPNPNPPSPEPNSTPLETELSLFLCGTPNSNADGEESESEEEEEDMNITILRKGETLAVFVADYVGRQCAGLPEKDITRQDVLRAYESLLENCSEGEYEIAKLHKQIKCLGSNKKTEDLYNELIALDEMYLKH
ncbi:MAG: hypothetical protein LBI26_02200 [Holosporales bacterium]|jgi:hypothetical protein|nr:hypothetical protein [Holosporales bacterium]